MNRSMRMGWYVVGIWVWLIGGALIGRAAETNALPHFQEVFRLIRANLPDVSEEELNRAAVEGLFSHFQSRVMLVADAPAASEQNSDALVSKTAIYDRTFGYLRVARVAERLAGQVRSAYEKLNATNKLKGLVLDARFAIGDDYAAAARAADLFLTKERTLLSWGDHEARSKSKTDPMTVPLVVLINQQTSGAAEALAAVLRETDAGLLIGSATAGRAHVFKEFELSNGQRIRIATSPVRVGEDDALTKGVTPDIEVAVNADDEQAYFADAFKVLSRPRASLRGTNALAQAGATNRPPRRRINEAELVRMQREGVDVDEVPAAAPRPGEETVEPAVRDPALVRALDLLKGLAVVQQAR